MPAQMLDAPAGELEEAVLRLPREARAALAARLLASLDEDHVLDRAWEEEIRRRLEDLRSGRMKTRPVEELLSELAARIG